jgi:uridine phosphorylase
MNKLQPSELILNPDGTIFHLHMKPEQLAKDIILVGDPGRVKMVSDFFDQVESKTANREFISATGTYKNKRITVLSTGIGTDNIDIVVNELDALVNIDLKKREIKSEHTELNLIRIGTSGALQQNIEVNTFLISQKAIGFDGLLNFYENRNEISDLEFERAFKAHMGWNSLLASPYVVEADSNLFNKICDNSFLSGITISAPGFYGPQGRELRLNIVDPLINDKIETFRFYDSIITNYEMECSAIYGLSKLLGHHALTVCLIIANRINKKANESYHENMTLLISKIIEKM